MADVGKRLIVRPTVAGFGVVVADCATCDPSVDYVGCIVVDLTPEYQRGYRHGVGEEVAYSVWGDGKGKFRHYTVDPGTQGT
jgi:hypothetical protein